MRPKLIDEPYPLTADGGVMDDELNPVLYQAGA